MADENPAPTSEVTSGQERLHALARTTLAIVWSADSDGNLTADNNSWNLFTGQVAGVHPGLDAVHPADRVHVEENWGRAVDGKHRFAAEYRLRRHDGVYRNVAAEAAPVIRHGQVIEWVGFCIDVTDQRRTAAALTHSESQLRFLDRVSAATRHLLDATEVMAETARLLGEHLGATRTAYADVDADSDRFHIRADWSLPDVPSSAGTYSLAMFGPQAVTNLHQGRNLVVNDVDRELGDDGGARMFNSLGIKAIICAGLVKEGRLVAMMAVHQSHPRAWSDREIAIVGEVVDRCWAHIERVRDNAELREQDRRKDEFLAVLSHELRNPLAPLRYAGALLRRAPAGSHEGVRAVDMIERQVGHMGRLIDDLLDLSRINRGLIHLRREAVSLRAILEQSADVVRPLIEAARHRLELRLPDERITVSADPARLVQAIGNLLNNAAKYTPDGGHLRLSGWEAEGQAVIEVRDDGIGIPPDQQPLLFQMFEQLPHTAERSQGGLGIGLALVKTLVELHGGHVHLYSAGLDQGSTFTLELPLEASAEIVAEAVTQREGVAAPTDRQLRILVIEDNLDGRTALVELLQLFGFDVEGAADGEAGLAAAHAFLPDAVLLDLGLPGIDGVEVARRLRADPPGDGALKIVAVTGWGSEADRRRTSDAGFDDHLTKPVDPDVVRETLVRLTVP
jgi:PAS domain S-box-containing protein